MMTLLKDVIRIPEHTGAEDYVLRLTDSVGHSAAESTIANYVVTPALAAAFDQALGLVGEAVTSGVSRGAFLAGSFGSGKSHFMAVLHALLTHEPAARAQQDLQVVIAKHDPDLEGRKILPLAFHLLGAKSLEQALFDGYLRQVKALHPDAPLPAVHKSDALLADADRLRSRLGDDEFFAGLNKNAASAPDDVWGGVLNTGTWNAESYGLARSLDPSSEERQQLASALVDTYFGAYTQQAEFVDIDTGLAAIARHAKALGYDAVVLFLDELVLWLAFQVSNKEFFAREAQKLTKLVESSTGVRDIPLISFVARQMDLRRWFADSGASGAEQEALDRAFKHQEGRFATIKLGDENLPYVASKRLLRPKDEHAKQVIADAFERIDRNPRVWDVLLDGVNTDDSHRGADEKAFRLTYPFSPALVSTLRALASVMQRERTALKVMQQMLVDQRETLTVDSVIPVGDSFDYIVRGNQVLDADAAALFKSANKLYSEKLQRLLREQHNVTEAQLRDAPETVSAAYRSDDRLAKTLLLSAVAPNVPALKSLTGARLASLNHGSILSPLPGNEASVVLSKVRTWARDVPEIRIDGAGANPTVRVQLSDVDYESIVDRAKGEDNEGRRRELVKTLVAESLGIDLDKPDIQGAYEHEVIWRGTRRKVDVIFGNVRDSSWLSEDHFRANPGSWRLVIDHPFDEQGHSTSEDLERLEGMIARDFQSRTIVWLPYFLAPEKVTELSRLVILGWLLEGSGERWQAHADHLSETDRALARNILESHRSTLRRSLEDAIQQAYGAASRRPNTLLDDPGHDRILVSLDREFVPQRPVGATLGDAFRHLVEQAYDATYPGHPHFEPGDVEIRLPQLRAVAAHVHRAVADKEKRVEYQGDQASVRRIAGPLGVGTASEMYYILGDDRFTPWSQELERALGRRQQESGVSPDDPVTVAEMRSWIDAVTPAKGLVTPMSDLVIITWAALRQRAWFNHGSALPAAPEPGQLQPSMELRSQPMPTQAEWTDATAAAAQLFGVHGASFLTAPGVADFVGQVRTRATTLAQVQPDLVTAIEVANERVGIDAGDATDRLTTARRTAELVQQLRNLDGVALVQRIATAGFGTGAAAAGKSLSSAEAVTMALRSFEWDRLAPVRQAMQGEGEESDTAAGIVQRLQKAIGGDEIVSAAATALGQADREIFEWLARRRPPKPDPTPPPLDSSIRGNARRAPGASNDELLRQVRQFLESHGDREVDVSWQVRE
ncbi:phage resistance protein [Intrasporangium chromatireducens Q5-1]|uniref:Phage resistance protein n=2 Tax=Intrasporangium TaxID=53357 RepID=W9GT25_9MICO|nr:phage resistance protein [Intrasporangium chromatireducens Q5-1]